MVKVNLALHVLSRFRPFRNKTGTDAEIVLQLFLGSLLVTQRAVIKQKRF